LETALTAFSVFKNVVNLFLSGFDRNREKVLRLIAVASPSFMQFYLILKDPSVGLRSRSKREVAVNYMWILVPVLILALFVYFLLNFQLDLATAGIASYVTALLGIPIVLWFGRRSIPQEVESSQGRLVESERGNKVLITFLHLKFLFQYVLLVSFGFLATALKTFFETPGSLFQGIGLLQNEFVDFVVLSFIIVVLIVPLWLLRRYQIQAIRQVENKLFLNHFELGFPQVEATINRKLGIEKVWGRVTAIGKRIEISKAGNYVENFEWRDVIGVAAVREGSSG